MYLFDAKIVAADNSTLVPGRFLFKADVDSDEKFAIPETATLAVEVTERGTRITPVLKSTRREDGFFDADKSRTSFFSEKITSHVLGDQESPGYGAALEAVWTGPALGHLRSPYPGEIDDAPNSLGFSLRRLSLRTALCDDGLQISITGEIGGAIFVGKAPLQAAPKGKVAIEFTLTWAWIAIKGWSLIWQMPGRSKLKTNTDDTLENRNPRHFESLVLCAPNATPVLAGSMTLDGKDPIERVSHGERCSHLIANLQEASMTLWPTSIPERLSNGLFEAPLFAPYVHLAGVGLGAIAEVLLENDEGAIDSRARGLGTLIHESGNDERVTQPIEVIRVLAQRSAEGIHPMFKGTLAPLTVTIYGQSVAAESNTGDIEAAETFEIDVLIPTALLAVRDFIWNRRLRLLNSH